MPSERATTTGWTPDAAAMRVSPAPCTVLKSSCLKSLPTTCGVTPCSAIVRYAFATPSWRCVNVL
jgi:hypothetical protein